MKKIAILGLSMVATVTFAGPTATTTTTPPAQDTIVPICDASVAGSGKKDVYGGAGYVFVAGTNTPVFVQQGFTAQCSANTHVSFREPSNSNAVTLGLSLKGNQVFGGNSNGGAINSLIKCVGSTTSNGACTVTEDFIAANWTKAAS